MGVGDWNTAVTTLKRGGELDPGNERISNLLLLCHCEMDDRSAADRERDRLFEHQNLTELHRQQSEFQKHCSRIRGWWTDQNWGRLMLSGDSGIFSSLSRDWEGVLTLERATADGHYQGNWESPKTGRHGRFEFRFTRETLLQAVWKASEGASSQLFFRRDQRAQL